MRNRFSLLFLCLLVPFFSFAASNDGKPKVKKNPDIIKSIKNDKSKPLRDLPPAPRKSGVKRVRPNPKPPAMTQPGELDPVLQTWPGIEAAPAASQNFNGIGDGISGFNVQYAPPDTNGDVGPSHYIQTVNVDLAVYSKTGTLLFGPVHTNTLWSGFGGPCETNNDGDPTVIYDSLANRWVIAQFALPSGNYQECVAVSATSDPTGSYYRYAFPFSSFNDYPKMGLWPDGYYTTYNMFNPYTGGRVCSFDRSKMLNGQPAVAQCFNTGTSYHSPLPADLDGPTSPPAGAPNYVMALNANNSNQIALFKFHVDWANSANSSLTGPTNLNVASFSRACSQCVQQPGTSQTLDSLGDRLMNRLRYRNFGSHESLVVNHSVTASGVVGLRWYEFRNPGGTPTVHQQGTFSPDATYRWMGSIAMDKVGNIALGYSASSTSLQPSIRYTGRLAGDPLGQMTQGEGTLINVTGSQVSLDRWGDYSDLTIDPSDDCTFWYTTEYLASNGSFNWRTRIGSFSFPSCTGIAGCDTPSGLSNNTASDLDACADTGVEITWNADPGDWGDDGSGTRTYDVLRNGSAIATGLAYGTTSFVDVNGANGTSFSYSVRYNNGCGASALTSGATAADAIGGTGTTQTATQSSALQVKNNTVSSALSPAFTIAGAGATSANVTWTLGGNTNLTSCVAVRLQAPGGSQLTLKAAGQANPGSANVLSFYQTNGPGVYTMVLQELSGCGQNNRNANISGAQMAVQQTGSCGGNTPPVASFTFSCTALSCNFTDTSSDFDGTISAWNWQFGDGGSSTAQNPSHTYAGSGTYSVTLTVTDNGSAQDSDSQNVTVSSGGGGGINLSASGRKVKGVQHADLTWTGATSGTVDVYRNGVIITTTPNDGAHTDNIGAKGSATYIYKVCNAGTSTCSNDSTVVF